MRDRIPTLGAIIGLAAMTALFGWPLMSAQTDGEPSRSAHSLGAAALNDTVARPLPTEWTIGGYGGITHTLPATVEIKNGETTDVTVRDFDWIGKPFKAPVYYGARIQRWSAGRAGGMLDFIHSKAIANPETEARYTGQHNGRELPETAPIKDVFSKLEFSHGHNMLTLNGLMRFVPAWFRFRPYAGLGGGISLPHTEIGFRGDNVRTYEYQYAGLVGQLLAGLEIQIGRTAVFLEYKFTYAPYNVPLTHRSPGWLLVTDLWQQIQDWVYDRQPPGGRLKVQLTSHHAVAGVLVKSTIPVMTGLD